MHTRGTKLLRMLSILVILSLLGVMAPAPGWADEQPDPKIAPHLWGVMQQDWTRAYPVIVQGSEGVVEAVQKHGGKITADLYIIKGVATTLTPPAILALAKEPAVTRISLDREVSLTSTGLEAGLVVGYTTAKRRNKLPDTIYPLAVGADQVWAQGIYGTGVTVAVIDTGITPSIRTLRKGIDGRKRYLASYNPVNGRKVKRDPNGHGSFVAGIIANSAVGPSGRYLGIAPNANLVAVRALDREGKGRYSRVIAGIQWAIEHKDEYNIRVMNLSLCAPVVTFYWLDALDQAVEAAWQAGIVVVVAAGNGGPHLGTITVPGDSPYVITVGALKDLNRTPLDFSDDIIPEWSSVCLLYTSPSPRD